jgi:arylsulfatase A-like enzyme
VRLTALHARSVAALAAALVAGCGEPPATAPAPPADAPNVILLTLDGLRADHLASFGYERETAPNIDWLAARGLALSEFAVSSCSTKISLTSLLTSLDYPHHQIGEHKQTLPDEIVTLAEVFQARGWSTAGFVGTPWLARSLHYDQGFDHYEDFRDSRKKRIGADSVVGAALEFLGRRHRKEPRPFFLYLHLKEPHPPWREGSPWLERAGHVSKFFDEWCGYIPTEAELAALPEAERAELIAKYDGAIKYADDWIGVLLAALRERRLLENTVIAVSTDHGMDLLDHYSGGHGFTPFDAVVRGFLVLFDGRRRLDPASVPEVQGRLLDVGPTLLGLAGLEAPPGIDGVDLLGPERPPELAFATCFSGEVARSRRYKLIRFDPKLVELHGGQWPRGVSGEWMLFDLERDPGETRDVGPEAPETLARLRGALEAHGGRTEPRHASPELVEKIDERSLERLRDLGYVE